MDLNNGLWDCFAPVSTWGECCRLLVHKGIVKPRYNGWTRSLETVPKINSQYISCCHLAVRLNKLKKKKDYISSLVRQQSANQGLSFPPLVSESCHSCRFTFMSIFSSTFSLTLYRHSAWWISNLSDPSISTYFHFRPSSFLLCSLSFMAFSCAAYVGFGWGLVARGLCGDGRFDQTEIFMYVCLCLCVRATSRVCMRCIFFPVLPGDA